MPSTYFQQLIRKELSRLMGISPGYYDIAKKSRIQKLKWFASGLNDDVFLVRARHLQNIIGKRLKVEIEESRGPYRPCLKIWVPPMSLLVEDNHNTLKHLQNHDGNLEYTSKVKQPPMRNKNLFLDLVDTLDTICHQNRFYKLSKAQKAYALDRVARQYRPKIK